jgi:hypothetical protein
MLHAKNGAYNLVIHLCLLMQYNNIEYGNGETLSLNMFFQLLKRGGVSLSMEVVVKLLEFSLRFSRTVAIESAPFLPFLFFY